VVEATRATRITADLMFGSDLRKLKSIAYIGTERVIIEMKV
jgi:hypothetical protein